MENKMPLFPNNADGQQIFSEAPKADLFGGKKPAPFAAQNTSKVFAGSNTKLFATEGPKQNLFR